MLQAPPPERWGTAQPYEGWARARAAGGAAPMAGPGQDGAPAVAVLRFAEAEEVLRDWRRFGSAFYAGTMGRFRGTTIREMDGARHRRYRGLVAPAFRASVLARWEAAVVRPVLDDLLDAIAPRGRAELVGEVTSRFPVQVICEILGLPRADHEQFVHWTDAIHGASADEAAAHAAAGEMAAYFAPVIADRRASPRGDLVSELVAAEVDGARLDDAHVLGFLRLLLPAGAETTSRALGIALAALLQSDGAVERLRADPSRVDAVVEETLRWQTSVTLAARMATEDTEIGGCPVAAGSMVYVVLASADHDESRWPDPQRWDPARPPVPHLAFGTGPHQCVGMHLARMELRAGLQAVVDRLPDLRLDPDEPPPVIGGYAFRGPDRLPVRFAPTP